MTRKMRMSGKALQGAIIELASLRGWRCAHTPSVLAVGRDGKARYRTPLAAQSKGFPDLLLLRDRLIVVEVKGDGDTLKPEQEAWLQAFRDAGVDAYVWTPKSLATGFVEATLS